jgi:hypothetical protein
MHDNQDPLTPDRFMGIMVPAHCPENWKQVAGILQALKVHSQFLSTCIFTGYQDRQLPGYNSGMICRYEIETRMAERFR